MPSARSKSCSLVQAGLRSRKEVVLQCQQSFFWGVKQHVQFSEETKALGRMKFGFPAVHVLGLLFAEAFHQLVEAQIVVLLLLHHHLHAWLARLARHEILRKLTVHVCDEAD
jgi:hypothetical protein